MERLNSVKCNSCGASLPVRLKATSVKCAFCNSTRAIEPGELKVQREALGRTQDADGECRDAMRSYVKHSLAPRAVVVTLLFFTPLMGIPSLIASFGMWWTSRFPNEVWIPFALPFLAIGAFVSGGWAAIAAITRYGDDIQTKTEQAIEQLLAQVTSRPQRGRCPQCGGEVQVPSATAALDCPFCAAPLVSSAGILIRWVEDAAARKEAWQDKAAEAFHAHMQDSGQSNRFPVRELAAVIGLMAALVLVTILAPRLFETLYQVYRMKTGQMYTPTW